MELLEYKIKAVSTTGGKAAATANKLEIKFDATSGRSDTLPNPAELLLTALAACILKSAERYSEILHYPYKTARVTVKGERNDNPPAMKRIEYILRIDTNIDERQLMNWHKNIIRFGTISNTLANACELTGKIKFIND